jgi:hypothetical protein
MKNNLKELFVPYFEALTLKELGFDEPCFANYTVIPEDGIDWFRIPEQGTSFGSSKNYNSKIFEEEGTISAPTFSQAFNFFREKYKLHGTITSISQESWQWHIQKPGDKLGDLYEEDFLDYEEAELECLRKLIEICKNTN